VVVDDLDVYRTVSCPSKANAITVVDANTVLTSPFTRQPFELVSRRGGQVFQDRRPIEVVELTSGHPPERLRAFLASAGCRAPVVNILTATIPERKDHGFILVYRILI
jgi:hypothetical protein